MLQSRNYTWEALPILAKSQVRTMAKSDENRCSQNLFVLQTKWYHRVGGE
ncbi:protein of unknown function [Rhodovastum atsumiense]|nr:protein of unknown function [Rhodovastum atsumiense]